VIKWHDAHLLSAPIQFITKIKTLKMHFIHKTIRKPWTAT